MKKMQAVMVLLFLSLLFVGGAGAKGVAVEQIVPTAAEMDLSVRSVKAKNGVVTSANPYASKIGMEILKAGGNAIDAAVAVSFTLGLVEPNASGMGGAGFMMISDADKNEQVMLDYCPTAPAALNREEFEKQFDRNNKAERNKNKKTGLAAGVPGAVDGWLTALDTYGTMSIAEVLAPVIRLAEEGFVISPHLAKVMNDSYELLESKEEAGRIFLQDGFPYESGAVFKNPDYATVLRRIAKDGKAGFYTGKTAQAIVDALRKDGNPITMEDMKNYRVAVRTPIKSTYRGYEIVASTPASTGGVAIIETLNMAEPFDLAAMKPGSAQKLHLFSEMLRLANLDLEYWLGDPDQTDLPLKGLTSKAYADKRRQQVNLKKAGGERKPGNPYAFQAEIKKNPADDVPPSTTHISIMDKKGNMVAMTNSVGLYFGCGVVPQGTGFVMNTYLSIFNPDNLANRAAPGKRPRSTMSPTFVFKDGKPFMTLGTPGGGRIPGTVTQILSNVIDHGMDIQQAINAPRIHQGAKGKLCVEGGISPEVVAQLKAMGHEVKEYEGESAYFGGVQGIMRDPESGELMGGADIRRDGKALGF